MRLSIEKINADGSQHCVDLKVENWIELLRIFVTYKNPINILLSHSLTIEPYLHGISYSLKSIFAPFMLYIDSG